MDINSYLRENNLEVKYIPKGEVYEDAIKATSDLHFSAGVWYLTGRLGDRFSPVQTGLNIPLWAAIEFLYRIGVKGVSFHYPGEFSDEYEDIIIQLLTDRGLSITSIAANTFSHPIFKYSGPAASDSKVRGLALELNKRAQALGAKYGTLFQTDWAGRDGFDGYFLYDSVAQWEWTRQAYADILMSVGGKTGIAIEFKPYDAPEQSVIKTAEEALMMCEEVENLIRERLKKDVEDKEIETVFAPYRGKMGVNIEDAHVYLSTRKVSEAVAKCIRADRLFLRHENDCEGRIDNDRIFGSLHFFDALEATFVQFKYEWDNNGGIHEPDIFPQKDDPLKAYIQSINAINFYYALAKRVMEEHEEKGIEGFYAGRGAAEVYSRLLDIVSKGVNYTPIDLKVADIFRKDMGL
ncbi:MAG: hypothetical protein U9P49_10915 [Thermodesulfobacteriota bacterium]|nr:hypothetical protein [Thermodesulfobacteriota bacterium]